MKTYLDCKVAYVRKTDNPGHVAQLACNLTMKKDILPIVEASPALLRQIVVGQHTSVLEHCSITVLIENVSRSFLAQITRHRIGSFTSGSQHYQEYSEYSDIVHPDYVERLAGAVLQAGLSYTMALKDGVPHEEARQVLPNAKAVNILWTVNARSLLNFFSARMCLRNVKEMMVFADDMHHVCMNWWPTLFKLAGPYCYLTGKCNQGSMMAKVCQENGVYGGMHRAQKIS